MSRTELGIRVFVIFSALALLAFLAVQKARSGQSAGQPPVSGSPVLQLTANDSVRLQPADARAGETVQPALRYDGRSEVVSVHVAQ